MSPMKANMKNSRVANFDILVMDEVVASNEDVEEEVLHAVVVVVPTRDNVKTANENSRPKGDIRNQFVCSTCKESAKG